MQKSILLVEYKCVSASGPLVLVQRARK